MPRPSTSIALIAIVVGLLLLFYLRSRWGSDSPDPQHGQAGQVRSAPFVFSPQQIVSTALDAAPAVDGRLDDAVWKGAARIGDFTTLETREPAGQGTELLIGHHGDVLYFGFRCPAVTPAGEAHGGQAAKRTTPIENDNGEDALDVYLSPTNDHTHCFRLHVDSQGAVQLFSSNLLRGELPIDRRVEETPWDQGVPPACKVSRDADGWSGELAVPLPAVGLAAFPAEQAWGFNVVRQSANPTRAVAWSCAAGETDVAPWDFGELYFHKPSVAVTKIDFGQPFWGKNTAKVTLVNRMPEPVALRLRSRVFLPIDEVTVDEQDMAVELAGEEERSVTIPYTLSWRGRWPIEAKYCQRVYLRLDSLYGDNSDGGETGDAVYATSFPVGHDVGLIPNERYGLEPDAPNPSADDPDFIEKKRAYIIGRIPEFRRQGRDAEDSLALVLAAVDGSVTFDLMQEGVMQRIADWLYARYDNDTDRMLGTMFFVHQRSVTRHSRLKKALNPLSVIRSGGGLDDDRVWAMAGILSRMKRDETGMAYRCRCLSLGGHVVLGVQSASRAKDINDDDVFDPDVGVFFYTADNSRLATLGDLRRDRELSTRMHFNNVRNSREFYFQNDTISAYEGEQRRLWPPGAPAW